jgi:hypothetical protein
MPLHACMTTRWLATPFCGQCNFPTPPVVRLPTRASAMQTACHGSCAGCQSFSGSLGSRGRAPPVRLLPRRAECVHPRVSCSAAGDVAAAPSTSSQAGSPPPSWPSAAARQAGYSATSRQPAQDVPARVSGRLPDWLTGTYLRNGPGDLQCMEHMFDGYGMLSSFKLDGGSNTASGSHRRAGRGAALPPLAVLAVECGPHRRCLHGALQVHRVGGLETLRRHGENAVARVCDRSGWGWRQWHAVAGFAGTDAGLSTHSPVSARCPLVQPPSLRAWATGWQTWPAPWGVCWAWRRA